MRGLRLGLFLAAVWLHGAAWAASPSLVAAYDARRHELLQAYQPHLFEDRGDKQIGYDTLVWTALHGCGGLGRPQAMLDAIKPPTRDFARPALIRYLFQYGSCLSDAQKHQLITEVLYPDQLFKHGTLNHAIMSSTSYYLLAEHDPELVFTDTDGRTHTAAEVVSRYKALLMTRFRKFTADGLNEQLSPTYATIDIYPLLNLVDFGQDPELRSAAAHMAVAEIAILRADSLDGALLPPLMRENAPGQLSSNRLVQPASTATKA